MPELNVLAPIEIDELEQRLNSRDPSIDVGRLIPQLIASVRARDQVINVQSAYKIVSSKHTQLYSGQLSTGANWIALLASFVST